MSSPLRAFYAAHADRLTPYQLPAYASDLNPSEPLWKKVKFEFLINTSADVASTKASFRGNNTFFEPVLCGEIEEFFAIATTALEAWWNTTDPSCKDRNGQLGIVQVAPEKLPAIRCRSAWASMSAP